jgi:hypothetical protein
MRTTRGCSRFSGWLGTSRPATWPACCHSRRSTAPPTCLRRYGPPNRSAMWRITTCHPASGDATIRVPAAGRPAGLRRRDLQFQSHLWPGNDGGRVEGRRAAGVSASRRDQSAAAILPCSAKPVRVAWQMVASLDLAFPAVAGKRSRWLRVASRLVDWALTASESDPVVSVRFFRVNSLIDAPIRLAHPAFVYRAAMVTLRRHFGNEQSRRAVLATRAG